MGNLPVGMQLKMSMATYQFVSKLKRYWSDSLNTGQMTAFQSLDLIRWIT